MTMRSVLTAGAFVVLAAVAAHAQETRAQDRLFLDLGMGYLNTPFTEAQLEAGYTGGTVTVSHMAARLSLLGYRLSERLALQLVYARPIQWIRYDDVTGPDGATLGHSVLTNTAGFNVRVYQPLSGPFTLYGEGGLGIITRSGFDIGGRTVVKRENFATLLFGGGLLYRINDTWDLRMGADYSPASRSHNQPHTVALSAGGVLHMRPRLAPETRSDGSIAETSYLNSVQGGISTDALGTGINHFFAKKVPIFWGGNVHVGTGSLVRYQRTVVRTPKLFALDLGAGVGLWRNTDGSAFWSVAAFPLARFTPLRTRSVDAYLMYSVAGPAYLSKTVMEGQDTGKHFTFQDLMGVGFRFGESRRANAEVIIGHFSNGNLFARNAGVKIPLTFTFGYAF